MSEYSKWLTSKGLKSNAATGTQFRMGKGLDPTDAQYNKLGLSNPGPPGGDPAQADRIPNAAAIKDAMRKYAARLNDKRTLAENFGGMKKAPKNPGMGKIWSEVEQDGGFKVKQPDANAPDTLVKDAAGNVVSATGASAQPTAEQQAYKAAMLAERDSGFSRGGNPISANVARHAGWKPGPGNQNKALHDMIAQLNWKKGKGKRGVKATLY